MNKNLTYLAVAVMSCLGLAACEKTTVDVLQPLKNDLLKKTTGPAVIGTRVEFAYAIGANDGTVQNVKAEASIAGATGTGFSGFSWYTDRATGVDKPLQTATDTVTNGVLSTAKILDVSNKAVTLRYFYSVPEAARGQVVSIKFSGTSSAGKEVTFTTPGYQVSKMDMVRSIVLEDAKKSYFSIADMKAYTKEEVEQRNLSGKIDFVYIYRPTISTYAFGHAMVSLANKSYITDLNLPAAWTKAATKLDKRVDIRDAQLRGSGFDSYIDDIDLEKTTFTNAADFAYGLAADQGAFVTSADGTYTAYIFVNAVNNTAKTMTVSMKRLKVK
nr:DUF4466 family protein [uncultured Arsenicibacter sp.]